MMDDGYMTSRGFIEMKPRKLVWMTPGLEKVIDGRIVRKWVLPSSQIVTIMRRKPRWRRPIELRSE